MLDLVVRILLTHPLN